jgi:tRNA nucleotidyltransferase (CCA-adding enzyme)
VTEKVPAEIKHVCSEVLLKISPTSEERKRIHALAKDLVEKVAFSAKKRGVEAVVRVEGSVAKDTWLREEPDVDVFMCLPRTIPRKTLGRVSLAIAREATHGWKQVERFAEHPYLEAFVEGFRVNIVPCYCAGHGEWLSATDRTPFHTDYVNKRLNQTLRDEIRLLKRFLQGIRVYGAEIKVGGFSGYLCELLIIHCGSFTKVLEAFKKYTPRTIVDIENYYVGREKELKLLFDEPLVIIDPVDKGRNVASAVKPDKIYTLVGAARTFLKTPNEDFFFPKPAKAFSSTELKNYFTNRGSDCIFLTFNAVKAVPDVIWGQLYRTQRALRKMLELNDFHVLRDAVWSDEEDLCAFVFELEQHLLSGVKKHVGPPLEREKECEKFLSKYVENDCVVSGPYVEDGRWIVEVPRKYRDAVEILRELLVDGGRNMGVASLISEALQNRFSVMTNGEAADAYSGNKKFAEFVSEFLRGKPFWLTPEKA